MGLYSIPHEMEIIDRMIDESMGELTPEIEAKIREVESQILPRIDDFCKWLRSLEADAERDKGEAGFFTKRRKVAENKHNRIKKLILDALISMGKDKAFGDVFTVAVRQATRPRITWEGKGEMPAQYTRTVIEPDGDMIYNEYKQGKLPKGFKVEFSNWLQIK